MKQINEETTLAELREFTRARAKILREGKPQAQGLTIASQNLNQLLGTGYTEPHLLAGAIGEVLLRALILATILELDPAGCLTLAQLRKAV